MSSSSCSLCLTICLARVVISVLPDPTVSEMVWLKDVTNIFHTDKWTLGDLDLPDDLTFHLHHGLRVLTLNLKRNHGIHPNANVYFVRNLKDGKQILEKALFSETKDVAYYQDMENGAFMTVRCVRSSNGQCHRTIWYVLDQQ